MKFSSLKPPSRIGKDGKPRYSTLTRSPMKRRSPKRIARRTEHAPFVAFIRSLNCISCGSKKQSDAAHVPVGVRGMGLKSSDANVVPLCRSCHRWYDGHTNPVLPREERRALAVKWLAAVLLLVTPESRDHALELQAAGLGTVVPDGDGWAWVPGSVDENNERKDAA